MKKFLPILIACTLLGSGCDEGRIYNDYAADDTRGGLSAHLSVRLSDSEEWPQGYSLALAGFAEGNDYALISKTVEPGEDGAIDIVLTGIPTEATSIELCMIDRLRRRVAVFVSQPAAGANDTIRLTSTERIDISMYGAIQRDIFNTTCAQCHGGANFAAAGLDLTEGKSYSALVSAPSVKVPEAYRVMPFNSEGSVLYTILSTSESSSWKYDHSVEIPAQERLELIKNWIDAGASL